MSDAPCHDDEPEEISGEAGEPAAAPPHFVLEVQDARSAASGEGL